MTDEPPEPSAHSALFDEAALALHTCAELRTLFRTASDFGQSLFSAEDVCLVLSRGAGLPELVWKMEGGEITETRLAALGQLETALRQKKAPFLLEVRDGEGEASIQWPQALFPGRDVEFAVMLPFPMGRHDLHTMIFIGGKDLADAVAGRALGLFHRHVQVALDRLLAAETENFALLALRRFVNHSSSGLIALDWELRPLYSNRAGIQFCGAWDQGGERESARSQKGPVPLPEDIFQECGRLKKSLAERDGDGDWTELVSVIDCPTLPGLRANVRLTRPISAGTHRPYFQVRLERPLGSAARDGNAPAEAADDLRDFLSPRERELLEVAVEGLSNEEIAKRLGKSLATVKSQIQSIYRKLSISNRGELIARLSGFSTERTDR